MAQGVLAKGGADGAIHDASGSSKATGTARGRPGQGPDLGRSPAAPGKVRMERTGVGKARGTVHTVPALLHQSARTHPAGCQRDLGRSRADHGCGVDRGDGGAERGVELLSGLSVAAGDSRAEKPGGAKCNGTAGRK